MLWYSVATATGLSSEAAPAWPLEIGASVAGARPFGNEEEDAGP